jgi:hypothetical protein
MAITVPKRNTQVQSVDTSEADSQSVASIARRITNPVDNHEQVVTPVTSADLLAGPASREMILLAGKDGVGKSCAVVSLAYYVETFLNPDARFYVMDTENKFRSALRGFGADAPTNIVYYKVDTMNQVTWAINDIMGKHRPGDWCAVESMSRVWERAQDLGYMAVSGYTKIEYMERRGEQVGKKAPVTPGPDQLWSVTKGAHDSAFLDRLTQSDDLNVLMTTTISKPPKEGGFIKENLDRKALRAELGMDAGIEGAPRLPYYVETLALLDVKGGQVSCRILRDNLSTLDQSRVEFVVDNRKSWAMDFWANCRGQ